MAPKRRSHKTKTPKPKVNNAKNSQNIPTVVPQNERLSSTLNTSDQPDLSQTLLSPVPVVANSKGKKVAKSKVVENSANNNVNAKLTDLRY